MRKIKYTIIITLCFGVALFPCFCKAEEALPDIVILYTGDGLGNIEPIGCCSKMGGMARRATRIHQLRQFYKQVLLLDAGDCIAKKANGPYVSIQMAHIYNAFTIMQYDALNIADGEVALMSEFQRIFLSDSAIPVISANIMDTQQDKSIWPPYIIKKIGGVRVAIIGVVAQRLFESQLPENLSLSEPITVLKDQLPDIRKKSDVVILLSHLGWEASRQIVKDIPDIDISIVGHDYTYPHFEPETVGNTLMVKNTNGGGTLGVIKIWMDKKKNINRRESAFEILSFSMQPMAEYTEIESKYKEDITAVKKQEEEEKVKEEMNTYLKLSPEQFIEQMKKENRLLINQE
ncbi:MAG: hypothetical protein KJ737_12840 [Proteobacteria bacterium]|nr:hypothetical protein [Pseudomonadota bacterium]